jgi:hypothetical protein
MFSICRVKLDPGCMSDPALMRLVDGSIDLGHPQRVAKSGSIFAFWLLELVPYTVRVVPNSEKEGTGASSCSDAKFSLPIK